VPRTLGASQVVVQRSHINPRIEPRRENLARLRSENQVGALVTEQLQVPLRIPGITGQIVRTSKLGGVDENPDSQSLVFSRGPPHKKQMAFMERAHRRYRAGVRPDVRQTCSISRALSIARIGGTSFDCTHRRHILRRSISFNGNFVAECHKLIRSFGIHFRDRGQTAQTCGVSQSIDHRPSGYFNSRCAHKG